MNNKTGAMILVALLAKPTGAETTDTPANCSAPDENGVMECTEPGFMGWERTFWVKRLYGRLYRYGEYPDGTQPHVPYNWPSESDDN